MKRIRVDFNTLTSAPEDNVKFRERCTPTDLDLHHGERVALYDGELELEAIPHDREGENWMATPIPGTWRDLEQATPGVEALEVWWAEYDLRHGTSAQ